MKLILLFFLVALTAICCEGQRPNIFRRGYNYARGFAGRSANIFRRGYNYARDFAGGSRDMWRAYRDMRRANWRNSDKYFHARGNYDAAQRGTGGRHAAALLSNAREAWQSGVSGRGAEDTAADQAANRWGRNGGDPNRYRPEGLPDQYRR